jgi:glycine/D-amino acid oxidase-like deaminating enzyme
MNGLSDSQRATLTIFCDTIVPSIEREHDKTGLWRRSASDLGVPAMAEQALLGMPDDVRTGLLGLLDGLAAGGFNSQSQASRELTLKITGLAYGVPAQAGVGGLIKLVLYLAYGAPDATGKNPNWAAMNYPGPLSQPPDVPKPITPLVPDSDSLTLDADVVIIGSGSGGGVIAGELSAKGLQVVVLEAGPYHNEADFTMQELPAFATRYWRGGPQSSLDLNFSLLAGACLGGGSTVFWANCLRTTDVVRGEWARAGLTDVATDFDRHLDAIAQRLNINGECSDPNPLFEWIQDASARLGWHTQIAERNADPSRYDPETAGYTGFGDQTGSKQSTMLTYLLDAYERGAKILVDTTVDRVLVEDGRAAGVTGTWTDPATGRTASVTVNAPQVVVAAGALESPAVLLRSGIGGPAVGKNLRLHPTTGAMAIFPNETKAWWGAPHTVLVDHFEREMEYGFRMEGVAYMPGIFGSNVPFSTAEEHKAFIDRFSTMGCYLARIRGHGSGQVVLDENGQGQVLYALTDEQDVATMRLGIESLIKLLVEAGALEIQLMGNQPRWRFGDDVDEFLDKLSRVPLAFGGAALFSAHQMGSNRMGSDPQTSVADPQGQLHDTPGVWIGDASAFPTASGTNPFWSVTALAHRTAENIAAAVSTAAVTEEQA